MPTCVSETVSKRVPKCRENPPKTPPNAKMQHVLSSICASLRTLRVTCSLGWGRAEKTGIGEGIGRRRAYVVKAGAEKTTEVRPAWSTRSVKGQAGPRRPPVSAVSRAGRGVAEENWRLGRRRGQLGSSRSGERRGLGGWVSALLTAFRGRIEGSDAVGRVVADRRRRGRGCGSRVEVARGQPRLVPSGASAEVHGTWRKRVEL